MRLSRSAGARRVGAERPRKRLLRRTATERLAPLLPPQRPPANRPAEMEDQMETHDAPLANVITLGARDLPALRDFYRRLGWPLIMDGDEYSAFELRGAVLALFPVDKLAADGREQPQHDRRGIHMTIGIIVDDRDVVDDLVKRVRAAGGRVTKEPVDAEFFIGRSAYFADPEGNFWEIAWAPPDNPIVASARRAARLNQ